MIKAANSKTSQVRQYKAGLALCVAATLAVAFVAWPDRERQPAAIDYLVPDDRVYVDGIDVAVRNGSGEVSAGLEQTKTYLRRLSETGDARYLRYAKSAMNSLPDNTSGSLERFILQARILQSEHQFESAAKILQRVTATTPASREAWLLLSDTLRRSGRLPEARTACFNLALSGATTLAQWCGLQILQSTGNSQRAYELSKSLLPAALQLPDNAYVWALQVAGDSATGAGNLAEAIKLYERAAEFQPSTLALRLAYADLLIDAGRYSEATALLEQDRLNTSALVRILIAQKKAGKRVDADARARVEQSFADASQYPQNDTRYRDQAIWSLNFHDDPDSALEFAKRNWAQQKGNEDLDLLRTAAVAAEDTETIAELNAWQSEVASGESS